MKSLNIKGGKLLKANLQSNERFIVHQGGTSAGKSWAILQALLIKAFSEKCLVSVVSENLPHLKRGVMRDFEILLKSLELYDEDMHNKSDSSYEINGSVIEFFGADKPTKQAGARRDYLFINECNNVSVEVYNQLEVRTRKQIFLDYNPTHEFWVHHDVIPLKDTLFIKSTYKDNPFLTKQIIDAIERRKNQKWWWDVYGLGEIGKLEGAIFKNWTEGAYDLSLPVAFGLDFGFHPDPTALIKVAIDEKQKKIYLDELCYATELSQEQIIDVLNGHIKKDEMIVADSADKRMIEAIYDKGFNIFPAEKGVGSVREGILFMQDYQLIVTNESHNLKKELLNYVWNDKRAGIPVDMHNHLCDATRYAVEKLRVPDFYFG